MNANDAIAAAKRVVRDDPQLAAWVLRDLPEVEDANLADLAFVLACGEYGCCENDVKGLIESLERHLNK